jgi:hypothetical protein
LKSVLGWFDRGHVGLSSEAMAFCAAGIPSSRTHHPHDPSDFSQCLRLVSEVPCVRDAFPEIAKLSPQWAAIIAHWDEIEALLVGETDANWARGSSAPETYRLMQRISDAVIGRRKYPWPQSDV